METLYVPCYEVEDSDGRSIRAIGGRDTRHSAFQPLLSQSSRELLEKLIIEGREAKVPEPDYFQLVKKEGRYVPAFGSISEEHRYLVPARFFPSQMVMYLQEGEPVLELEGAVSELILDEFERLKNDLGILGGLDVIVPEYGPMGITAEDSVKRLKASEVLREISDFGSGLKNVRYKIHPFEKPTLKILEIVGFKSKEEFRQFHKRWSDPVWLF